MFVRKCLSVMAVVVMEYCLIASGAAQGKQLTTEDYARAEKFMGYNVNSLVYHGVARPAWMGDGRFWYRDNVPDGVTFMVVDPVISLVDFEALELLVADDFYICQHPLKALTNA